MSVSLERARRLARKPPRYLVSRAADEIAKEAHRATMWAALHGRGPLAAENALSGLPGAVLERTARAGAELGNWSDAVGWCRADPDSMREISARVAQAKQRRVALFGEERVSCGTPPRWLEDVRSGESWPLGFHRRIDYVNRGRASDVKLPWELSRLRHAVALAQGVAVSHDVDALEALEMDLASWRLANPLGWSVNWTCAMEVALRAINTICIDAILVAGGAHHRREPLVASLYQHGWFLFRHLEVSDVNGNHFLADAVGLIWLGRYFDGLGESSLWLARGLEMVESAASDQVLPDGLDHEGSLPYHVLVLELFLVARTGAGRALAGIDGALESMVSAASAFVRPDGRLPLVGDDDGGRALALSDTDAYDAGRVLALGAGVLGESVSPELSAKHFEDALWLLGMPKRGKGDPPRPATAVPHLFPHGGIAVLGEGADHVVVDVGPIGFRGRGGHGHADAMSFEAVLGGALAVRDSGTGSYTGDPQLRNELRDVTAHSSVVLDGIPYTRIGGVGLLWQMEGDSPPRVLTFDRGERRHKLRVVQELPSKGGPARWLRQVQWQPSHLEVTDELHAPSGTAARFSLQLPGDAVLDAREIVSKDHIYEVSCPTSSSVRLESCRWSPRYGSVATGTRAILDLELGGASVEVRWVVRTR